MGTLRNLVVVAFVLGSLGEANARPRNDKPVPNGMSITSIRRRPYQVSLLNGFTMLCGGTIVSKDWILTTAWCLEGFKPEEIVGIAGSNSTSTEIEGQLFHAGVIHTHPLFNPNTMDYDFASIKTASSLKLGKFVRPIRLAWDPIWVNQTVRASGWNYQSKQTQIRLLSTQIISNENCTAIYKKEGKNITERMFCAYTNVTSNDSPCTISYGGPVTNYWGNLVGLYSFIGTCDTDPAVFSSIQFAFDWIASSIRKDKNRGDTHSPEVWKRRIL